MAKRKYPKLTPEEHAQRDETQRLVRERIAYHEAKAREAGEWISPPAGPPDEATNAARRSRKMTPEEHAQRDETQRLVRERIPYRDAKEREEEERRAREQRGS